MSVSKSALPSTSITQHLVDDFERELEVEYREERYRVRDNGAVCRLNQFRKRARPLDKQWTFGRQNPSAGYMHLAGVPVHRIICTAFHSSPPTDQHVVDHIDTNRANNRPENLRWVSRLENVLLNPISARRIELLYGSIEAFFQDPQRVQGTTQFPDVSWMRTVSKDEAMEAKQRLLGWAQSGSVPSGGALGEWLYGTRERADFEPEPEEYESLTPSVVQVRWKVPSEFPGCPASVTEDALDQYAQNLTFGALFVRNDHYTGHVVQCALTEDGLAVLSHTNSEAKGWAVVHISVNGEFFFHRSIGTFFTLQGALKAFCSLTGENLTETIDDYC
jgi:hypothetical protein